MQFLIFILLSVNAQAQTVKSLDFTIHQEYTSTRALGMGNAFTAVADDHSAIFYNPAALAFRKDGQLRMFIRAGATPESIKLFDEIDKAGKATDKEQAYTDLITSHYGDHFYYRVPTIGAVWARPGWGIAFVPADLSMDASVHRQLGPMLNVNTYVDTTLAFAYARKLKWLDKRHQLSWGATVKSIHRFHIGEAVSAGQLSQGQDVFDTSHANEGMTVDLDLGLMWKPPADGFMRHFAPTFAFTGRNLVDYGFKTNYHFIDPRSGEPPKLQRRFDVGSKWELPKFWVFDPHFSIDVRDMGHENWTYKKGLHAGMELYWKMFNWWKGHWAVGMNQMYWTAGFGARLAFFQLDLASFGEEVGTDSARKESRRYMVEMALDF